MHSKKQRTLNTLVTFYLSNLFCQGGIMIIGNNPGQPESESPSRCRVSGTDADHLDGKQGVT